VTNRDSANSLLNLVGTIASVFAQSADGAFDEIHAQLSQRDGIFAFAVIERAYDRTLEALESVSNRVGVLIAVQAALEAVLIDKLDEFGRGPGLLGFGIIVATALQLRAGGDADFIAIAEFLQAFARLVRRRRRLFTLALVGTVATIAWATAAHMLGG
jgi:hypothetical protein